MLPDQVSNPGPLSVLRVRCPTDCATRPGWLLVSLYLYMVCDMNPYMTRHFFRVKLQTDMQEAVTGHALKGYTHLHNCTEIEIPNEPCREKNRLLASINSDQSNCNIKFLRFFKIMPMYRLITIFAVRTGYEDSFLM